jgi:hypothetical protein
MLGSEGAPAQQCAGATRQEAEERVWGSVSAGFRSERGGSCDRLFLESGVGVLVNVGGLGALVTEPERDRGDVDALAPEEHRAAYL